LCRWNPNGKIPALIDPQGPNGQPLPLFESGAILIYLADKAGKFMDPALRYQTISWLMFQMGGIGPMFGQVGFFHKFAGKDASVVIRIGRSRSAHACSTASFRGMPSRRSWMMRSTCKIEFFFTTPNSTRKRRHETKLA
jgi:glutathione S-transferase